ncbi:hypothetical protein [Pseudonocardia sp.]
MGRPALHGPEPPARLAVHTGCGRELGADFRCRRCGEHVDLPDVEFRQ